MSQDEQSTAGRHSQPDWKAAIRERLAHLKLDPVREAEIAEELAHHMDDRYQESILRGLHECEARRAVLAELSEGELLARELRGVEQQVSHHPVVLGAPSKGSIVTGLWQDTRYAGRMLLKQPAFALITIVTLALGIGANTTIFSLLDGLLLKPLPGVADPGRLAQIGRTNDGQGFDDSSYADYRDYRDQTSTFAGIAAESEQQFHLGTDKAAERVKGSLVSGNYFEVLGAKPVRGRLLQPSEAEVEGANPVAVISERLWQEHFDRDPDIAGKTVTLNSHTYTIIGVVAEFHGTSLLDEKSDVWIPITMWRHGNPWMVKLGVDWLNSRNATFVGLFGRFKQGVTIGQARADLSAVAERLSGVYPQTNSNRSVRVAPTLGMSPNESKEMTQLFSVQFGIVVIVLLIACANVAGLLLARLTARQKEIGVRLALGAGRLRVVRQLLVESTILSLCGGVLALLFAVWLTEWIRGAFPDTQSDMQARMKLALDLRVLGFTFGLSVVTGLLFGLVPALQSSKLNLVPLLKDAGKSFSGTSRTQLRSFLVIAQIAMSLTLLVSAGLCVRTLLNVQAIDVGFATDNLLTARIDLGRQNYSEAQGRTFYQQLLERTGNLPGVEAASLAISVPLQGSSYGTEVGIDGKPDLSLRYNIVTPNYLDSVGIPLLAGRHLSSAHNAQSPRVAIINETFARRGWPDENAVGKYFRWRDRGGEQPVEIIGVARDVKGADLFQDTRPTAYFPMAQKYDGGMTLHLRTSSRPEQLIPGLQQELRELDPGLPIYNVKTLEQYRRDAISDKRIKPG